MPGEAPCRINTAAETSGSRLRGYRVISPITLNEIISRARLPLRQAAGIRVPLLASKLSLQGAVAAATAHAEPTPEATTPRDAPFYRTSASYFD
jgi:hypothetical protein